MGRPRTTRFFVGMVAGLPHAILSMVPGHANTRTGNAA